ncbi:hypothetical protein [Fodinicola feengrottensis]|uniref:hypothetical protein n=1 Tax=Fodinicola feengrottensis TaxID=435914 RepID=UPI00244362D6|nr:hypothetical protein [Fodinicola feengrottensis]
MLSFAQARNLGLSLLTAMGNEAMVSVTDVVDYLVDDPATKVIALFLESVRHPAEFAAVARKAWAAGKPIVAMKIGSSQLASQTARAHTGALVGDDDVVSAAFRQLGVVRVRSLEDLIITAGLLASVGSLPGRRLGVVTPSGGGSEIHRRPGRRRRTPDPCVRTGNRPPVDRDHAEVRYGRESARRDRLRRRRPDTFGSRDGNRRR